MCGCINVPSFKEKYAHLPQNLDEWLNERKEKISVYKRNNIVLYIGPLLKKASICAENFGFGEERECSRINCKHFHICKHYLNGLCRQGPRCRKGHYFENGHNRDIKERNGLQEYTDDEMKKIILWRYPQVCKARNCLLAEDCPYLHICYNFIKNNCDDSSCPRGHPFETSHNKWVLSVYRMERWPTQKLSLLKSLVNMPSRQKSKRDICCMANFHADVQSENYGEPLGVRLDQNELHRKPNSEHDIFKKKSFSTSSSVLDKNAHKTNICHNNLTGGCQGRDCNKHHTRIPYLWQIRIYRDWISFDDVENQKLERRYCNLEDTADGEANLVYVQGRKEKTSLNFSKDYGIIEKQTKPHCDIRRLTSVSFVKQGAVLASDSFHTQWRWYFQNDFKQWIAYEKDEVQYTLEKKYMMKQKSYLFTREGHKMKYRIEFSNMRQINIDTSKVRIILRRPAFVSLADVISNSFPRSIHISIPVSCPSDWDPLDVSNDFEWVDLDETGNEFKDVQASFFKTLSKDQFQISNIYRIQNLALKNEFNIKKTNMERTGGKKTYNVDERSLFHGTDSIDTCYGICTNNFDFRLSGKNATVYGKGSYFAISAKYSHNYTKGNTRFMFRAKVLIGSYTKGKEDLTCPPNIPGEGHRRFDSCVDNTSDPSIFIVFDRNQTYPEYLIAYQENIEARTLDWQSIQKSKRSFSRSRGIASRSINVSTNINNVQNNLNTLVKTPSSSQGTVITTPFTKSRRRPPLRRSRPLSLSNNQSSSHTDLTSTQYPVGISNSTSISNSTQNSTSTNSTAHGAHVHAASTGVISSTTNNYQAPTGIRAISNTNNHQASTSLKDSSTASSYQTLAGTGSSISIINKASIQNISSSANYQASNKLGPFSPANNYQSNSLKDSSIANSYQNLTGTGASITINNASTKTTSSTSNYQASNTMGPISPANNYQPSTGIGVSSMPKNHQTFARAGASSIANNYQASRGIGSTSVLNNYQYTEVTSPQNRSFNSFPKFSSSINRKNRDPYSVTRGRSERLSSFPGVRYRGYYSLSNIVIPNEDYGCCCLIL
ncbi:protein mono-ADP-ribosyltransferase PARP12-like [Saccostrea cucullata]|uniref:protein mono-ADP-ribosyltransferase PARP12-like n=1 Tax=Saccostrea cuccullata TaxID=36930 RepID=UPI002ED04C35